MAMTDICSEHWRGEFDKFVNAGELDDIYGAHLDWCVLCNLAIEETIKDRGAAFEAVGKSISDGGYRNSQERLGAIEATRKRTQHGLSREDIKNIAEKALGKL